MKSRRKHLTRARIGVLLITLLLVLVSIRPALAHDRIEIGPYVVIVGWETEPVIVGERNALYFEFYEDGEPLTGVESNLDLAVNYAGQTFRGNLNPNPEPGVYTTDILPTARGQYQVLLSGNIEDTVVNELLEPEEVLPAAVLQFPGAPPDAMQDELDDLASQLDDLASQLQTMQLMAIGALVLALAALAVSLFTVLRNRGQ